MNHHIHRMVDQLLLEQGEYLPLELLLQEGRLNYTDYEAWRSGELHCLDEALFGDPEQMTQLLQQAADYLQHLGWQAETIAYRTWQNSSPRQLRFSQNSTLDHCFHQRYRKPQDQPQLDLFTDAPATNLINGITQALIDLNTAEARRQLEHLYDNAPDHIRLGELECLVEASESQHTAVGDAPAELQILQETLIPLADRLLGKEGRNLLVLLWRRLSRALHAQPYQASQPKLHVSYTATQAMDWDAVNQAIEQEPNWQTEPVLLLRHATASDYLHRQAEALQDWFLLCWQFPEKSNLLKTSSNHALRQQWLSFLDLDPELPAQAFPAWLLIAEPGLTRILPEPGSMSDQSETACPTSYRTLYLLQRNRLHPQPATGNKNNIALRVQFKQQTPILFQHFLDSIDKSSPDYPSS